MSSRWSPNSRTADAELSNDWLISQIPRSRLLGAWLVAVFSFLGIAKCLLNLYREELEIGKTVLAVKSMSAKIHIEFRTRWQPNLTFVFRKRHGTILNVLMLQAKPDLRYLVRQI